eukprot:428179-Pyramimonas_sp.AAC.1
MTNDGKDALNTPEVKHSSTTKVHKRRCTRDSYGRVEVERVVDGGEQPAQLGRREDARPRPHVVHRARQLHTLALHLTADGAGAGELQHERAVHRLPNGVRLGPRVEEQHPVRGERAQLPAPRLHAAVLPRTQHVGAVHLEPGGQSAVLEALRADELVRIHHLDGERSDVKGARSDAKGTRSDVS